ncbi:hypothetical protein [Paenibacillus humicola]|uniref:hypothetical protein n=1 Tax=Paenibacillus humicola TaxID=3110540 RepID=UPI00237B034F|nr:hypothetical protein [Paenibacillus humicola]
MPDWSYQTIFRPLLFRLPAETARDITLGAMGTLSRLPFGQLVIRTLGHMEFSGALVSDKLGFPVRYPVGLAGPVDPRLTARKAMSPFGFGFMEIGPVTPEPCGENEEVRLSPREEAIFYPSPFRSEGIDRIERRLRKSRPSALPNIVRITPMPGSGPEQAAGQLLELMRRLEPYAAAFIVDGCVEAGEPERTRRLLRELRAKLAGTNDSPSNGKPLLLALPLQPDAETLAAAVDAVLHAGWRGFYIADGIYSGGGFVVSGEAKRPGLELLRRLRLLAGEAPAVLAACGVHEPQDALELRKAGADAVLLHSGLVYAGPGLPKRINEALIYETEQSSPEDDDRRAKPGFFGGWGWMTLLGLGMIIGGILAWIVASTSVMLPYDAAFLGEDRSELIRANPRLLGFMSHDRVTLAGTMISIGVLYAMLGRYGLGRGLHWAKTALLVSGIVGFSSFFLYLGYGYFDPLHALAAALLLPLFVLAMRGRAERAVDRLPALTNGGVWKRALWGQLCFVALGAGLGIGGIVIALVGITNVFVPEDLMYLCTSADTLRQLNERLLPLIAHDRAGFGGALFSDAAALLATALWGVQEGRRWLWYMLLAAGTPAFAAGLSVHLSIGYTNFFHLLPLYGALAVYIAGLILLYPYLTRRPLSSALGTDR